MVGGGQLARMTHQAAIALGQSLHVLAVSADDPVAMVSPDVTVGSHTDLSALRSFAAGCDVLTFDHEHVPTEHLRALVAEGVTVHPGPDALVHAQDKLVMRAKLASLGVPVPEFAAVTEVAHVVKFGDEHGWPCVLKAARGGDDGGGGGVRAPPHPARAAGGPALRAGKALVGGRGGGGGGGGGAPGGGGARRPGGGGARGGGE